MVERQAGPRHVLNREEIHFVADPAVIALLGFLLAIEEVFEVALVLEGGAVDARLHRVLLVAAPVGARDLEQFDGTDLARRLDVRAGTEVLPLALPVKRDRVSLLGELSEEFELCRARRPVVPRPPRSRRPHARSRSPRR